MLFLPGTLTDTTPKPTGFDSNLLEVIIKSKENQKVVGNGKSLKWKRSITEAKVSRDHASTNQ